MAVIWNMEEKHTSMEAMTSAVKSHSIIKNNSKKGWNELTNWRIPDGNLLHLTKGVVARMLEEE